MPGWARFRPGRDRDDLLDAVAGQQHTVAVENLAPGRRDVDGLDPLALAAWATASVLASTPCRYQSRPKRAANRQTTTTSTAVARSRTERWLAPGAG